MQQHLPRRPEWPEVLNFQAQGGSGILFTAKGVVVMAGDRWITLLASLTALPLELDFPRPDQTRRSVECMRRQPGCRGNRGVPGISCVPQEADMWRPL